MSEGDSQSDIKSEVGIISRRHTKKNPRKTSHENKKPARAKRHLPTTPKRHDTTALLNGNVTTRTNQKGQDLYNHFLYVTTLIRHDSTSKNPKYQDTHEKAREKAREKAHEKAHENAHKKAHENAYEKNENLAYEN